MDANKIVHLLATILMTLDQTSGESREGILYAALMDKCTLDELRHTIFVAVDAGMAKRGPNFLVKITEKGRDMARKLEDAMHEIAKQRMQQQATGPIVGRHYT